MNEYEEIIISINNILNTASSLDNKELQQEFLMQNADVLQNFKDSLIVILRSYQFKENGNTAQNDISDKLKNVISMLLEQKSLFENQPQFEYFISELLDGLNYNENKFAFNLQYETNMGNVQTAIEHLQTRADYLRILEENGYFQDDSLNGSSALSYRSSKYEENMLGHALIQIKNNFLTVKKEDIIKILQCIDNSDFFDKLIQKSDKQMDFYDKNLIFQYTDTILKLKSIFTPETIKDDKFVQAMWNGEIKDSKTIQSIVKNISVDTLDVLLNSSSENSQTPFLFDLANHFKQLNYSDKNIALVINEVLNKGLSSHEIAKALAKIDIPKDFAEFMDSEHSKEYSWLLEGTVFQTLKESEKDIEDAKRPFLPAEYYIKKLDVVRSSPDIDKHFVQNLITLLHSDYYTEDEKIALTKALKKNDLYSPYITDEKVTFDKDNSNITTYQKVIQAYFSGQVIPLDISTSIINQLMTKPECENATLNKKVLEACVQSVVSNQLAEKGIDIGNRVFFGNGHSHNSGYYQSSQNCIWIDDNLINKFIDSPELSDKADLFRTMFHEMHHAEQQHNINNGNIDYLTYNFIKESVLEHYDENFYNTNYRSFYMESDARKEEILGSLEFLKRLNPEFVKAIRGKAEQEYVDETCYHTIYGDSEKKIGIGKNGTKINISDYVGLLIQSNPQILTKNPILSIEYNPDGSQKDMETLLQDFEQRKSENPSNYSSMYSIYYGLVSRALEQSDNNNPELQEQVSSFLQEQPELISLADMQVLYKNVPVTHTREVYSRLLTLTRNLSPIQSVSKEGVDFDDNSSR